MPSCVLYIWRRQSQRCRVKGCAAGCAKAGSAGFVLGIALACLWAVGAACIFECLKSACLGALCPRRPTYFPERSDIYQVGDSTGGRTTLLGDSCSGSRAGVSADWLGYHSAASRFLLLLLLLLVSAAVCCCCRFCCCGADCCSTFRRVHVECHRAFCVYGVGNLRGVV